MQPEQQPRTTPRLLRLHLALGTAIVGLGLTTGVERQEALAGTCTPLAALDIVCSGAADADGNDMTQILSGGGANVSVTTSDDFGIDTSNDGGDALTITGITGLIFDDTNDNGSAITGAEDGIDASNSGGGELSITTRGTVTGVTGNGISANNGGGGTVLTILTETVGGSSFGINAVNSGTGDLSITANGPVTSNNDQAIYARNNNGGALSITATDKVSSANSDGINAQNDSDGSTLTISAAAVSGGNFGILARNFGTGDLSITASGSVTGMASAGIRAKNYNGGALSITATDTISSTDASGIDARNDADGSTLTISATASSGATFGIDAKNLGSSDLSVTASGAVTGGTGAGLRARNYNGGAVSVVATDAISSTSDDGIFASNDAAGSTLTISAAAVSGANAGIDATNKGSGHLTITTSGPVTGDGDGISAQNYNGGDLKITASDSVSSTNADGIFGHNHTGGSNLIVSAALASGDTYGIDTQNDGTGYLSIATTGPISGDSGAGINAVNSNGGAVTILAVDSVSSTGGDGLAVLNNSGGSTLEVLTKAVSGAGYGITAVNKGGGDMSVTAAGPVTGGSNAGLYARNNSGGALSITTTDTVSSTDADGILTQLAGGGTTLTISAASVSGGNRGIFARNFGTGDLNITATGQVTGGTAEAILARNYNGGAVVLTTTGPVYGASGNAISVVNNADGSNTTISVEDVNGKSGAGLQVDHRGSGDLLITVSGTVTGTTGIINSDTVSNGGKIVLTDTATVEATGNNAITDGDGDTHLSSEGAIVGNVLLRGGQDTMDLIAGSAPGTIDLGDDDDAINVFGSSAGGTWDDSDFSGGFDNNGANQPLSLVGGDGYDTVSLFGVTAASAALGDGSGFELLSFLNNTVIELNSDNLSDFGALFVDQSSTLKSEGNSPSDSTVGALFNAGAIDLEDGASNDSLTVEGNYAGALGSTIWLDFDGNTGTSDRLVLLGDISEVAIGDTTASHEVTTIHINTGGFGEGEGLEGRDLQSFLDDIHLIEVLGAAELDDFELAGPVEFGVFDHELVFEDGTFRLRPDFFDQLYTYENLPGAMQTIGLALTGQLVERVGVRSAVPSPLTDASGAPVPGGGPVDSAIWGRAAGLSLDSEGDLDSVTGTSFEQTIGFLQAGVDVTVLERDSGRLLVGALGHWGTSSLDVLDSDGDEAGGAGFDFYGGGLTATWYSTGGWYFDNVFQYTAYDIDIDGGARFETSSTDGYGIALSHELGYRIPISETAVLVPQAQITYQHTDFDDFVDPDGITISLDDGDSLVGRLGVAFENSAVIGSALATGYVEANVLHEFLGDNSVSLGTELGSVAISQDLGGTAVELGFGGTIAVNRGVSLFAEVDYQIPFDNGLQGFQALGGIRINLDPAPPPPPPAPVVVVEQPTSAFIVFFDWDRAELTPEANLVLDDVVVVANEAGYASIRLDGYTDLSGSAQYNLGLSERRANSVANGLIARGIAPDEIVIRAFGEENPLVPTPDGVREPQNRRVEIFLQ